MSIRHLDSLFDPASVAVIGASLREASVGGTVWRNLRAGGFAGPVWPVNPKHATLGEVPCFASVDDLPQAPELAVICTPPATVPSLIAALGARGTKAAVVLTAGTRLTPQALGLAASVGAAELTVWRRPRVAVFSTGDELVMPGQPLKPGAIYNSNRFTLRGLLQAAGCDVTDLGIVPDRLDATRDALKRAAEGNDLILTSGGVSVGEEDHLRPAVMAEGTLDLWQIAMKPGKPLAFGTVRSGQGQAIFMGLPGNPVSSFVTFLLAVAPVLRTLQGMDAAGPSAQLLRADFDWPKPDRRREFLRVKLNADGGLDLFPNQSSGVLTSTVWADGLVDTPAGQSIARGDLVRFLPLDALVNR